MAIFPTTRLRRNKKNQWIRDLVCETSLEVTSLIWPIFIIEGNNIKEPILTMPGVYRFSIDLAVKAAIEAKNLGIPAIALFPSVNKNLKSDDAKEAFNKDNLICRAVKAIKDKVEIGIICDVALDPYTTHGHDGIVINNYVANDETIEVLIKQALVQADAGCDIIAPSDMMDGRVYAIREALDSENFINVSIMSYAAKYASKFYGPFRDAVGSRNNLSGADKRTYQLDPRNIKDAMIKIEQDVNEGADMIIIKPGMPYLDVLKEAANNFSVPFFAYQVSGEYSMMKFAADNGCFDFIDVLQESLLSFKRAGARGILTYGALDIAKILNN